MPSFIPDGFSLLGCVAPLDGIHEGLRFRYRPALPIENQHLLEEGLGVDDVEKKYRKFLLDHLLAWDLSHEGQRVPLTLDNCGRLNGKLRNSLVDIVMGWKPSEATQGEAPIDWDSQAKN